MPTSETPVPSSSTPVSEGEPKQDRPGDGWLRVALPNKGALAEDAAEIMGEAGYRCRRGPSSLRTLDRAQRVEFIFLRPRDIATYVGEGIIDVGVTGRDLVLDSGAPVTELLELQFGHAEFRLAAPRHQGSEVLATAGIRIATAYPTLLAAHLAAAGLSARVVALDGAVELAPSLGVADLVADVVQTGRTLQEAGLEVIGDPIVRSQALLVGPQGRDLSPAASTLVERVRGVVVASTYLMIEYDLPAPLLDQAASVTPGLEAPTVSPLQKEGWLAIRALAPRSGVNEVLDRLYDLGARGIIATDVRTCRF